VLTWDAEIFGADGTPCEGGVFQITIRCCDEYPFTGPRVHFETKIFHVNVTERGDVILPLFGHEWGPQMTIWTALLAVVEILDKPLPEESRNDTSFRLWRASFLFEIIGQFCQSAKDIGGSSYALIANHGPVDRENPCLVVIALRMISCFVWSLAGKQSMSHAPTAPGSAIMTRLNRRRGGMKDRANIYDCYSVIRVIGCCGRMLSGQILIASHKVHSLVMYNRLQTILRRFQDIS
jgi:hypothetical protein